MILLGDFYSLKDWILVLFFEAVRFYFSSFFGSTLFGSLSFDGSKGAKDYLSSKANSNLFTFIFYKLTLDSSPILILFVNDLNSLGCWIGLTFSPVLDLAS